MLCGGTRRDLEWIGRLTGQVRGGADQEVGRVDDSFIRFMFGSNPSDVVSTVSPNRRSVRSKVTKTFR